MEKHLTAIEWLVENTALKHLQHICLDEINQAKEMEKQQRKEAYILGRTGATISDFNETYDPK